MNREQIVQMQRQLRDQSKQFETQRGLDMSLSVLDTCSMLLRSIQPEITNTASEDVSDLFYAFLPIASYVSDFIQTAGAKLGPTQAERLAVGTKEALERMQEKAKEQKAELSDRAAALERVEKEMNVQEEEKRKLDDQGAELARRAEACSEEILTRLMAENEERNAVVTANETRLTELREQADSLALKLQEQDQLLESFPETVRKQRETFQEHLKTIEELKNAKTLYSPEIMETQQDKVGQLTREVERLSTKYNTVQDKIKSLEEERDTLMEKFPQLETTAITACRELLNKLTPQVEERLETVTSLKATADKLERNLAACNDLRKRYRGWLQGVQTPLESLLKVVAEPESETLRKTMDPAMMQSIRQLLDTAHSDLKALDDALRRLTGAYEADMLRIRRESVNGGAS